MPPDKSKKKVETNIFSRFYSWLRKDFFGIIREMRWSYLPPLMVYLAAGISGFTGIIESFFVKEELGVSAAFLAGLAFWAGIPWALKMPLGHLVDLFWRRKAMFVYLGAALMAVSLLIMIGLTGYTRWMTARLPAEIWYIISVLLSPVGFVMQDVVADAMTVEAVPAFDEDGAPIPDTELQRMHVTVQTLGRIAIIGGSALVAGLGGWLAGTFSYALMYWLSLIIPLISVSGVVLGGPGNDGHPNRHNCAQLVHSGRQRRICGHDDAVRAFRYLPEKRGDFHRLPGDYHLPDGAVAQGHAARQTPGNCRNRHHYLRISRHADIRRRCQLVANRCAGF
jgi:hypothetical protein